MPCENQKLKNLRFQLVDDLIGLQSHHDIYNLSIYLKSTNLFGDIKFLLKFIFTCIKDLTWLSFISIVKQGKQFHHLCFCKKKSAQLFSTNKMSYSRVTNVNGKLVITCLVSLYIHTSTLIRFLIPISKCQITRFDSIQTQIV